MSGVENGHLIVKEMCIIGALLQATVYPHCRSCYFRSKTQFYISSCYSHHVMLIDCHYLASKHLGGWTN